MIGRKSAYALARALELKGKGPLARSLYEWILNRPSILDERVPQNLGKIYIADNKYGEADRVYATAITKFPVNPKLYYASGFSLERQKKWESAIDFYRKALDLSPEDSQIHYRIAQSLVQQGELSDAARHIRAAMDLEPGEEKYYKLLLTVLKKTGPTWLEEITLDAAVVVSQNNSQWHFRAGELAAARGDHQKAAKSFEQAARTRQDSSWSWYMSGVSWEIAARPLQATTSYAHAIQYDKRHESKEYGVGRLHQKRGMWSLAADSFLEECKSQPSNAMLHYHTGHSLERSYKWKDAIESLRTAVLLDAKNANWIYKLGYCYERNNQFSEAAVWYKIALDESEHSYWRYRLIAVLVQEKRFLEACTQFKLQSELDDTQTQSEPATQPSVMDSALTAQLRQLEDHAIHSQSPERLRALCTLATRYGQHNLALSSLQELIQRTSHHSPADYLMLAQLHAATGNHEEACRIFLQSRVFKSAHGADTKKYTKSPDDHVNLVYIEYYESLTINDSTVLYESFQGSAISENPLAIFRELYTDPKRSHLLHVWVVTQDTLIPESMQHQKNIIFVNRNSVSYAKHLASAKYLVNNNTFPPYFIRKENQLYLNTWHGVPLKTIGSDILGGQMDHRNATRNFLQTTHLLFPNAHTETTTLRSYGIKDLYSGKIIKSGYPRVDLSINITSARKTELRALLDLKTDDKVLFYAPTWRGDLENTVVDVDRIVSDLDLMSNLGYEVIFRGHHMSEAILRKASINTRIAPRHIDTNELLAMADLLITDYSSIAVDFYALKKPVIYHAYDYEQYQLERGLYFDLEKLPGILCRSSAELREAIKLSLTNATSLIINESQYREYCPYDDGIAAQNVVRAFFDGSDSNVRQADADGKKSILFYEGPFNSNGITTSFLNLVSSIDSSRFTITVVVQPSEIYSSESRLERFRQLPAHVNVVARVGQQATTAEERWLLAQMNLQRGLSSPVQYRIYEESFRREYLRIFGTAHFDVVVNFEGYSRFWAPLLASSPFKPRTVIYQHNDMVSERNHKYGYLDIVFESYHRYDSIMSVSDSVLELNRIQLTERLGLNNSSFDVCNNLMGSIQVMARSLDPMDDSIIEWLSSTKMNIVTIGRLSPEKGHEKLIQAFYRVLDVFPNAQLTIVGEGPLEIRLKSLVKALDLESRILFTGVLSNPFPLVAAADLFVLSSDYEGQGLVLLEAMALGIPVLSTDVVGPRSVLANDCGLLVENSEEGLVYGIGRILSGDYQPSVQFSGESYDQMALSEFEQKVLTS